MPYELIGDCVHKKGESKPMKCYPGEHGKAVAYMRALEANMPENEKELSENKWLMMLSQAETNYGAASGQVGKACSNCRWFCSQGEEEASCHLIEGGPEPIAPNGLCDRWEAIPTSDMPKPEPLPVTIVEPPMDMEEMALPTNRKGLVEIITDTLKSLLAPPEEPAFSVFKANGRKYWIARHTGKWKDREDEIIANHAHDEYITRVQSGAVPLPELWTWHKKGSRHGQADFVWKSGGFTLALGHFDDTPEADRAFQFYQKQRGKIKLSHMFNYPKRAKQGRVFHAYNTVEITTLPAGAEAFPYTSFEELDMSLTEEQRAFIQQLGGDDMLRKVEAADNKALSDTSKLDALGIESKGVEDFTGSTIPIDKDMEALKTAQSELETRLKAVEALPDLFAAVQAVVKALTQQVNEGQQRESELLAKTNALEKKLLEYQAVQPPASKSNDTLLNEREKSLIEALATAAKSDTQPSLIGMMSGQMPAAVTE